MSEWLHDLPLKDIAFKPIILMPSLLLQKLLTEIKIKRSFEGLGTKIRIVGVRKGPGTVKKSDTIQKNMKVTNKTTSINEIFKKKLHAK